jgi:seryl-tRNA synthetase
MHDIRAIRENPELYEKAWAAKGSSGRAAEIVALDEKLRAAQTALQTAQAERNGQSLSQHGAFVFTLRDGKVTEVNEFQEDTAKTSEFWA